jgi:hypothetical protein
VVVVEEVQMLMAHQDRLVDQAAAVLTTMGKEALGL